MTLPATDKLNELSRDELIALIGQLVAEIGVLRAELDKLQTPPTTSRNSSQPSSRDWKSDQPADKRSKKRGAQPGHAKAQRPLVDNPTTVLEARVTECPECGADLRGVAPQRIIRRQVTELPEIRPVVIETRQHEVVCPGCQRLHRGPLPEGLEASRQVGPRLEALVTYLHHEHHLGFARLGTVLQDVFRTAIHLGHQRDHLTARGFHGQVTRLEQRLDGLLERPVTGRLAWNLLDRYRTHREHLFVFLYRADVSSDNNACERALRPSVIHRKVMGSFRSEWGPRAYAALATVINTAKRTGENVFQKLAGMMGKPVLHYLDPLIA